MRENTPRSFISSLPAPKSGITPRPDARGRPGRHLVLIAVAIGIVSFTTTLIYSSRAAIFDDAFITATFARNLAHGHGLTWTPGEVAFYGPTSLPFTLLLAVAARLGFDAVTAAVWLGSLGWGVAHACLFLIAVTFLSRPVAIIATCWSAALLVGPRWSVGMETGVYVAVIVSTLLAVQLQTWRWAFGLAVSAAAIRPDGVLMIPIVGIAAICTTRYPWRARIATTLSAAAPAAMAGFSGAIVIFVLLGTVIPNSVAAKRTFPCDVAGCISPAGLFGALAAYVGLGTATFLVVFALVGAVRVLAARAWSAWPMVLCGGAYLAAFTLASAPNSVWYYAPLTPALVLCCAFGIAGPWPFRTRVVRWLGAVSVMAAAVLTTRAVWSTQHGAAKDRVEQPRAAVAESILQNMSARNAAAATVLSFEVGYFGYSIPGRIIDLLGVVTPGLQPCLQGEDGSDVLRRFLPDYVVVIDQPYVATTCIAGAPALKTDYVLLARVSRDFGSYLDNYLVYRRK